MIEGFTVITSQGTVWERMAEAIHAYQEKYGRNPYVIHVDARLLPFQTKGIHALDGCLEGQIILMHEPISGHCHTCNHDFTTDSGSYPKGFEITGDICGTCATYGQQMT